MTREHKLALIVGFSLILLVGVLISDHLSSARQAQVGAFGPADVVAADSLVPRDPLRDPGQFASGQSVQTPPGWTDPRHYHGTSPDVVPPLPSPIATTSGQPARSIAAIPEELQAESDGPVLIGQGAEMTRRLAEQETGLADVIAKLGGEIVNRNGVPEIVLPHAARTETAASRPAPARRDSRPTAEVSKQGAEEPGEFIWHTVQRGESLSKIAAQHYGNGNLWRELARHNSDRVDADGGVRVGVRLRIPVREGAPAAREGRVQTVAHAPAPSAPARRAGAEHRTYTVRRGDTLGVISQRMLGTSRRWREIAELNGIEDEDVVHAGRVLKIPAASNQG